MMDCSRRETQLSNSTPSTTWTGTTGAHNDRPTPERILSRIVTYVFAFVLFPTFAMIWAGLRALFVYARMPWWAPAPVTAVVFLITLGAGFGKPFALLWQSWGTALSVFSNDAGFIPAVLTAIPVVIAEQFWLAILVVPLLVTVSSGWQWLRRPKWEEREIRVGWWLQRRLQQTTDDIAAGKNAPLDGVTVGVAVDKRDGRFAGGKPGAKYGTRVVLADSESAGHTIVTGGAGSGKTTTSLMGCRDVIRRGHGLIFVDAKGGPDVPERLAEWARRYGRQFHHWDIADVNLAYTGPADGLGYYDPIGRGDPSRRKDLIIGGMTWDVEYYKSVNEDYLQTAFTVARLVPPPPGTDTLSDIISLLDPTTLIARSAPIPKDQYPGLTTAIARAAALTGQGRSAIENMHQRLNLLAQSTAGPWLRRDPNNERDIDLLDIAYRGDVVVFSLDTSTYEATAKLITGLIVQDLKTVSSVLRDQPAATPTHVYIDEFSAVDATNISGLLAKARDARMPVTLITQALGDLKRSEPNFDSQVLGIVGSFLIHRSNTEEDARVYAGLSGVANRQYHQMRIETTSGALSGGFSAGSATGSGMLQERETTNVLPGVFQELKQGYCIFIAKLPVARTIAPVKVIEEQTMVALSSGDAAVNAARYIPEPAATPGYETFPISPVAAAAIATQTNNVARATGTAPTGPDGGWEQLTADPQSVVGVGPEVIVTPGVPATQLPPEPPTDTPETTAATSGSSDGVVVSAPELDFGTSDIPEWARLVPDTPDANAATGTGTGSPGVPDPVVAGTGSQPVGTGGVPSKPAPTRPTATQPAVVPTPEPEPVATPPVLPPMELPPGVNPTTGTPQQAGTPLPGIPAAQPAGAPLPTTEPTPEPEPAPTPPGNDAPPPAASEWTTL